MNRSAFAIAASTILTLGSAAHAAEPAQGNSRPSETTETATPRAPALLASATVVHVPTPQNAAEVAPPVKKPRAARVTSCRCGEASPR